MADPPATRTALSPPQTGGVEGRAPAVFLIERDEVAGRRLAPSLSFDSGARVSVFDRTETLLQQLGREPPHVIVVADELPEHACPAILRRVQQHHPEVIRVVLTDGDGVDVFRRVPYAHQFFRRSAPPAALAAALARCLEVRTLLGRPELRVLVSASNALPAAPKLYAELIDLLADPRCSMLRVVAVIERDAGMTARLMQLVSSAFFGMSSQVTSLGACVGYLGLEAIRSLVLSAEISQRFPGAVPGFSPDRLQARALATSRLARRLGGPWVDEGQAFVAGLLHGVGQLVLAARAPALFTEALALRDARGLEQADAEQAVLGATSAEVGAYLLGLWGQPLEVVRAIAHQDHPEGCDKSAPGLATVIYLSKRLSQDADVPLAAPPAGPQLNEAYLSRVGALERLPALREVARRLAP